jgi:hypothetical protein
MKRMVDVIFIFIFLIVSRFILRSMFYHSYFLMVGQYTLHNNNIFSGEG